MAFKLDRPRQFLVALFTYVLVILVSAGIASANPDQWRKAGFTTDFSKAGVPFTDILSGGPPKDGIPSIDAPVFEPVSKADWLDPKEAVIRLEIDGKVKAYPLRILIWHEIVNDSLGGVPVSVTYCPLCNSSIAFSRTLDGHLLDFGTTGLLRNSDLVMYDRQTETWWQQFTGEAIVGTLTGKTLKMLPSRVVAFSELQSADPQAMVLSTPQPARRPYGRNPYPGYDSRSAPYPLFQGELPAGIEPMARVVVVRSANGLHAVALAHLRERETISLSEEIELSWSGGQASALDADSVSGGRDVGTVKAVRNTRDSTEDLVHDITFAFVVHAFHPELGIIGAK